jgi:hypothetical protein
MCLTALVQFAHFSTHPIYTLFSHSGRLCLTQVNLVLGALAVGLGLGSRATQSVEERGCVFWTVVVCQDAPLLRVRKKFLEVVKLKLVNLTVFTENLLLVDDPNVFIFGTSNGCVVNQCQLVFGRITAAATLVGFEDSEKCGHLF